MKYNTIKITDKVYLLEFDDRYDLAMFFLRYQEFYECINPEFRNKSFQLIDFMEWYAKAYGKGVFSYPQDWQGFNIPSRIIDEARAAGIWDKTKYDYDMLLTHRKLKEDAGGDYYLIGTANVKNSGDSVLTLAHEVAHGLYYTIEPYRAEMTALVENLDPKLYKKICAWLKKISYTSEVFMDETQAYTATGFSKGFKTKIAKEVYMPFLEVFERYAKDIPLLKEWKRE